MPATPTSPVANSNSPAKTPLSVQRPELSPRKRKFSTTEVASPTSLDEVSSTSSSGVEEHVISPKKKVKAEERGSGSDLTKWENNVVASIASALDMDCLEAVEPISFLATPASDLTVDELEILYRFLA
ncbi:hypothetical protein DD238_001030 [Peronospora effusa]|uniref:Uncharacterized protein n=1 Tax=Peronospora effusa TaxID=542832 RepID=A0A3M6VUX3_9STRA|nr:hypothetical protein DD238_001030 [Peronospora effusa]